MQADRRARWQALLRAHFFPVRAVETCDAVLARLVPEYVTLPRGVRGERGEVAWSRGPR